MPDAQTEQAVVRTRRWRNFLLVELEDHPGLKDWLTPHLKYTRRVRRTADEIKEIRERMKRPGKIGEYKYVDNYVYECTTIEDRLYLSTPLGLFARVAALLEQAGLRIEHEDTTPVDLEDPDYEAVGPMLREGQPEIMAAVTSNQRGIIVGPTGLGKSYLMRCICKLYPNTPIVICVHRESIANSFWRELLEWFSPEEVGQIGGGKRMGDRRITIVLRGSLKRAGSMGVLERCRLFLYDEVHTAGGIATCKDLAQVAYARMFGFTASLKRSDKADLAVEALFGCPITDIKYQEEVVRGNISQILVKLLPMPNGPIVDIDNSTAFNRNAIWRNKVRNKAFADEALVHYQAGRQVMLAVDTTEHAVYLYQFLKAHGFILIYRDMEPAKRKQWIKKKYIDEHHPYTTEQLLEYQKQFETGELRGVIATTIWDTGVDFRQLEVVARVGANSSSTTSIQLPGRLSRLYQGKNYGLLIDSTDEWLPKTERRSETRVADYRKRGWPLTKE